MVCATWDVVPPRFDTYLHLIGLETLSLRIEHQVAATRRLAEYCRTSPFIKKVSYVGFENHRSYANARKYFKHGASGVLNIELKRRCGEYGEVC